MQTNKLVFLVSGFLFFFSLSANAQEEVFELQQCVEIALNNSITIGQAKLSVDQAAITKKAAIHARYPNLNASSSANLNFGRSIDLTSNEFTTSSFFSNGINLSTGILLYGGNRINNTIKQADKDIEAATKDIKQTERDLALQVAVTYLNALFAQENIAIARYQKELSESQLDQLDKFINAGARPRNDRLDLEAQVSRAEQSLVSSKNAYDVAILSLQQLMNIQPNTTMVLRSPAEEISVLSDPFGLNYDEVFQKALKNQPGITAAELRRESAEIGIDIAKSGFLPSVSFGGSVGTNYSNQRQRIDGFNTEIVNSTVFLDGNEVTIGTEQTFPLTSKNPYLNQLDENLSYGFGVSVNVPIYNNYQTKSSVERAKLNVINSQLQKELLKQNLRTNVQNALLDARAAKKQMEASSNTVDAQKAAYDNAKKRFDLGAISTFELINVQNQYESSQVNLTVAKYDYLFKMKVLDFYQGNPISIR